MESKDELNTTATQTYLYLIKVGKPVGPREVMREAKLTSPSVAYRNLQKLIDMKLAYKDKYGNYTAKEKISFKGHIWIGKKLIPRFIIFGFIFVVILFIEAIIIFLHLDMGSPIEGSFWLLTILTVVSAVMFIIEGFQYKKRKLSI